MKNIQKLLSGGDLRSIGKANKLAGAILTQKDFDEIFSLLFHTDQLISMRAADMIEKVTILHPDFLSKHKKEILELMKEAVHKELKWHIALLLPRLSLNKTEQ